MKNTLRRVLGAAVLLGVSALSASAMTISYYVDVFSTLPNGQTGQLCVGPCPTVPSYLNNGSASNINLTLPQFNQLGNADEGTPSANHIFALTSVALALDWKMVGNVTIYNFYSAPVAYDYAQAFSNMTLTAGGTQVVGAGTATTGSGVAPCCNINNTPPFVGAASFSGVPGSGANSQFAANVSYFEGFGANTFLAGLQTNAIGATGQSSDPHSASLAYAGSGQMGAIMTITYNYTEQFVPEPGTLALMGSSLIGLSFLVRRKRMAKR